jgi:hypothetical protein
MSPKCLHGGNLEFLISPDRSKPPQTEQGFPNVEVLGVETWWRHQLASTSNNEGFFSAQDIQSCDYLSIQTIRCLFDR